MLTHKFEIFFHLYNSCGHKGISGEILRVRVFLIDIFFAGVTIDSCAKLCVDQ